ncbi:MAG: TlpA disulfide reductase family protein [Gemmatimonas sp.]
MTARQQWAIVGIVVAILGGGLWAASHFMGEELAPVNIGSKAPVFKAATVDETPLVKTLKDYKGDVVLLNIWATTCPPCRQEMPSIDSLYQQYKGKGLRVVAISTDPPGMAQNIRDFVKQYKLSFDVLYDSVATINQQYQIYGYPYSFIISRDGVIHKKWVGPDDWNSADNRKLIEQLLAESH